VDFPKNGRGAMACAAFNESAEPTFESHCCDNRTISVIATLVGCGESWYDKFEYTVTSQGVPDAAVRSTRAVNAEWEES
jgi:hypothetical protein